MFLYSLFEAVSLGLSCIGIYFKVIRHGITTNEPDDVKAVKGTKGQVSEDRHVMPCIVWQVQVGRLSTPILEDRSIHKRS